MALTAKKTYRLLVRGGVDATFTVNAGTFDPVTSTTSSSTTDHTHKVVQEELVEKITGGAEVVIYVSPYQMTFTPAVGMRVTHAGKTWTAKWVNPVASGNATILWAVGLVGVAS